MKRILIVYNPRSSRFADVKRDCLSKARNLKGYMVGKYEVEPTNIDANITKFSKLLKDGDLVISAGGDATGVIAVNAILKSGKDVTFSALPYGNFNDLSRTLGTKTFDDICGGNTRTGDATEEFSAESNVSKSATRTGDAAWGTPAESSGASDVGEDAAAGPVRRELYPLEIHIDGKFFRYATCYVTIGMTAEAVYIYDQPAMRRKLKTSFGRAITSYTELMGWYFKHRHKRTFIPEFKLNGELQPTGTSDYAAVNGRSMARVMKGGNDYLDPHVFHRETDHLTKFWRLFKLMFRSIFFRIPGTETSGDIIEFTKPATVTLQAEGEHQVFKNIRKIEIKKGKKCLKVIQN